ncbi:MAG TPA: hypothetical protein VFI39_09465 [Gemmatimonadales bacterium]|nr:hypothetical protein [Gemmatimonadales bacterium]
MSWILLLALGAGALFLFNTTRMRRIHSAIRAAYIEDGLSFDDADKVAWYLVDMFIYMRNKKDPKLANVVMTSTMTMFRQRLYNVDGYPGKFAARMQVDGIRDACLAVNRPAPESADLVYDAVVAGYEAHIAKDSPSGLS